MNELITILLENIAIRKEREASNPINNPWHVDIQDRLDESHKDLQDKFDEQIEKALDRIKQKKKDDE